ncbi:MAG: hypothetical protein ABI693_30610 [Bryobacteraceae bacterium]
MVDSFYLAIVAIPVVLVAAGIVIYRRRQVSPDELERRRRTIINAGGRMVDATVVDVHDSVVQFTYEVRGVTYTASQDLSGLTGAPADPELLLGGATVKFLPRDPANSIVVSETWSGMRRNVHSAVTAEQTDKG